MNLSHKSNIIRSLFIVLSFLGILSCSTEKNAFPNRAFHNTTAKYNGYFNANEIIKESMLQFEEGRAENYHEIIPIYVYANNEESKSLYAPMDTAAAKCEIVIGRHSMPAEKRGKNSNAEWCKWIDDNWITIGWAQFYKRDFESAMEKFKYIENQYKTEAIIYEAKFWQAKTLIEIQDYLTAEEILLDLLKEKEELALLKEEEKKKLANLKKAPAKRIKSSKKKENLSPPEFPDDLINKILPTMADLYIRTKDFPKAIEVLEKAILLKHPREFKTRLIFILAQIHHRLKDSKASDLYAEVVKRNPDYEMAFQAKINRALAFGGSDSKSIKNQLLKMLKDDKNIDYFDQIYYALAEIEIKENNRLQGIEYLELSVETSVSNAYQKTTSYIRLADLYYEVKNYRKAHEYFENCMSVIPKEHENYKLIESKNKNLKDLIFHLDVIYLNDSILNLCQLPEKEVLNIIKDIIDKKKEEIERKKEEKEMNMLAANSPGLEQGSNGNVGGMLFMWDENLRGLGFNDFNKIWGDQVKLEDNWRRSDKNTSSLDLSTNYVDDSSALKELTIDFYLDQLPCGNEGAIASIENELMLSLYDAGSIYLHLLNDEAEAAKMYERVSKEFLPENKAIAGLYQLYLLYKEQGKTSQSNTYKNDILTNYKNSEYAQLILNPNYLEGQRLKKQKQELYYKNIYSLFSNKEYEIVINKTDSIINKDSNNVYLCKYSYLNALSKGYTQNLTDDSTRFENALAYTVKNCKSTDFYAPAKQLLDKLRNIQSIENAESGNSNFIYNSSESHFFALYVPKGSGNVNSLKVKISNFNKASFSGSNLKTSSSFLNSTDQLILVKQFNNVSGAIDYYTAFKVNNSQLKSINANHDFFVISDKNLAALYLEKNLQDYLLFFENNYLK